VISEAFSLHNKAVAKLLYVLKKATTDSAPLTLDLRLLEKNYGIEKWSMASFALLGIPLESLRPRHHGSSNRYTVYSVSAVLEGGKYKTLIQQCHLAQDKSWQVQLLAKNEKNKN
jgi:hypothetical protein